MEPIIAHVREGQIQEVRLWLDSIENDVNQGDEHLFTLLHWAAREGHMPIVDLLVSRGARVNATNMGDDTALHLAAAHGHSEVVHYLLSKHPLNVDVANEHGNTALHYACFWDNLEIAERLICCGASLTQENRFGTTPLELVKHRSLALLRQLAEGFGHDLTCRRPFSDQRWLGTRTRARDASVYRLDGESWNPNDVEIHGHIGDTHGAEVLKGTYRENPIVVKVLKLNICTIRQVRDFKEELTKLRIFNHPNILPVLASSVAEPRLCLVSDYMPYGSLFSALHNPQVSGGEGHPDGGQRSFTGEISLNQAFKLAIDVAKAMSFLHTPPELKVPNFRLNSKHVMLDEDVSKIGMLGDRPDGSGQERHLLARLDMADYKFSFHEKAREYHPAWMSPEALQKKPSDINLEASDMWSFGVLLWELVTQMVPFEGSNSMVVGMQIATEGLRLTMPPQLDKRISRLIELCTKEDAGKRPRFDSHLFQLLDKMRERAADVEASVVA